MTDHTALPVSPEVPAPYSAASAGSSPNRAPQPPPDVSVVIPCPHGAAAVAGRVRRARTALSAAGLTGEVVVVDDGSDDGLDGAPHETARAAGAVVVVVAGAGSAYRAGLAAARGRYLVTGDPDDSYDFGELARLVAPLASGRADYAIGDYAIGDYAIGRVVDRSLGRRPADAQVGMRAFTRSAYERMGLGREGTEFAAETVAAAAAQAGLRGAVVPAGDRSPPRALDNHLGGADAANYRAYELELVAPYCGRHVLEVGSGLGEFAERLTGLAGVERLTVSDTDPMCIAALVDRFSGRDDLGVEVDVRQLDVALPSPLTVPVPAGRPPVDTVVMMNVLEHVSDDVGTLRRLAALVGPGGRLVIWVPAYEALYGDFDRAVGHLRRYTPATVRRTAEFAGLTVDTARPVNLLGGLAWWLAVRLGGQQTPDPRWVRAYDRVVVPATRALERVVRVPFGQSVLCVARVPAGVGSAATAGGSAPAGGAAARTDAIAAQGARATLAGADVLRGLVQLPWSLRESSRGRRLDAYQVDVAEHLEPGRSACCW